MKVCCLVQDVVKVKGLTPFTGPRYPINKYLIIEIQLMLEGTWSGNFWDVDGCTSFAFHVENCLRNFRSDSLHSQHGAKLLRAWVAQVLMCSSEHSLFLPWESSEPVVLGWHSPGSLWIGDPELGTMASGLNPFGLMISSGSISLAGTSLGLFSLSSGPWELA